MTIAETANWLSDRQLKLTPAPQMGHDHRLEIPNDYHRLWFETPLDPVVTLQVICFLTECPPTDATSASS
jgi:hypothetical protein